MSEITTDAPATDTTPDTNASGTPEAAADAPKGNREARYRTERNAARQERDALQARVEALQTRELERLAGKHLSAPEDLLGVSGNQLSEYLTEDGELDAERIEADALAMIRERPGLGLNGPAVDFTQGHGGGPGKGEPSWGNLFR